VSSQPASNDWDPRQYLKFEDERTRPARDLLAQVPLERARFAVDVGCGPGNSTELLVRRYPGAMVMGVDSSEDMVQQARKRLPGCEFIEADIATWTAERTVDLLFANAVFQWVPDHLTVMKRLIGALPPGGVLAAQMPDNTREPSHVLMRELSKSGRWASHSGLADAARADLPCPEFYYDLIKPVCEHVEIWQTIYHHVVEGPKAIVEWFKGSALRPFVSTLNAGDAADFLEQYTAEIARYYPERPDGNSLLRFPRFFVVATR
jgi:trans-aconitate 2-methyltransferase